MSMVESRREAAERIVSDHDCLGRGITFQLRRTELAHAIEAALKERDERAAKIADKKADTLRKAAHVVQQPTEEALRMAELAIVSIEDLARAIRNEDTN